MELGELSLQQKILTFGVLHQDSSTTLRYQQEDNQRVHDSYIKTQSELAQAERRFRIDPKDFQALCRQNIFAINSDPKLPPSEKAERVKRYIDNYLDLIIKMDRVNFPPTPPNHVNMGVPDYIPDGLSDMGSDPTTDPRRRSREKIRVDKKEIFRMSKGLFYEIFSQHFEDPKSDAAKMYITKMVAQYVYDQMPYDYHNRAFPRPNRTVGLHEYHQKQLAVCRHHALYTQVLLQAFGISSRLLKCEVDFGAVKGPHGSNLVRINNSWYLLDTTNPDITPNKQEVFLRYLQEKDIDTKKMVYEWRFKKPDGQIFTYRSRNNMYWQIKDNSRSPLHYT